MGTHVFNALDFTMCLVLANGGDEEWDANGLATAAKADKTERTAVAFGMATAQPCRQELTSLPDGE